MTTTKTNKQPKAKPSWSDVKSKLADFDRTALLQLVSDLYAANKETQSFLHARFSLGANPLENYKTRIKAALVPNIYSRTPTAISITAAKQAISEYIKAIGDPIGVLELRLFWCEEAVAFSMEVCLDSVSYFDALMRQYRDACAALPTLAEPHLTDFIKRLENLRDNTQIRYGVEDGMNDLLDEALMKLPGTEVEAEVPISGQA